MFSQMAMSSLFGRRVWEKGFLSKFVEVCRAVLEDAEVSFSSRLLNAFEAILWVEWETFHQHLF
jgi:hypothetical protein